MMNYLNRKQGNVTMSNNPSTSKSLYWTLSLLLLLVIVTAVSGCDKQKDPKTMTPEELLATIDGVPSEYQTYALHLDKAQKVFKNTRMQLADYTVNVRKVLKDETGKELSCLNILIKVTESVPESMTDAEFSSIASFWLVLVKNGSNP